MKRVLMSLLLLCLISCVKVEPGYPKVVPFGYFTDSYYTQDYLVLLECTVSPFLEGESMVQVWVHNEVFDINKKEFILDVELGDALTTSNFQRELNKTAKQPRIGSGVSFVIKHRGLEVSWKMFDEIYSTYE